MTVTGWITSGSPTDTVFVMSDSVDLRPAMNNDAGMLFKAHAADGVTVREYKLKASNSTAYKTSTAPDKYNWSKVNVSNLPSDVKLTSAVEYNNALYMVTESKRVFSSTNGGAWTEVTTLGDNVIVLINGFSDRLSGIVEINGKQYFNICKDGKNWEAENTADNLTLEEVPAGFPTENISTTQTNTGNGVEKVVLAGLPNLTPSTTPSQALRGARQKPSSCYPRNSKGKARTPL